jgi:hypothetical protein
VPQFRPLATATTTHVTGQGFFHVFTMIQWAALLAVFPDTRSKRFVVATFTSQRLISLSQQSSELIVVERRSSGRHHTEPTSQQHQADHHTQRHRWQRQLAVCTGIVQGTDRDAKHQANAATREHHPAQKTLNLHRPRWFRLTRRLCRRNHNVQRVGCLCIIEILNVRRSGEICFRLQSVVEIVHCFSSPFLCELTSLSF